MIEPSDIASIIFSIRQDHIFLAFLIITASIPRTREVFRSWSPFILLWFIYDMMRGLADNTSFHVYVKPVYDLELSLFGWMFGGDIPAFWFQDKKNSYLSIIFALFYAMHIVFPLGLAILIRYVHKDLERFRELAYSYIITTYSALVTFFLFPVAPPWYVWNNGNGHNFSQPGSDWDYYAYESGKLFEEADSAFNTSAFFTFYGKYNANPFAAFPSLHAAFSLLFCYYAIKKYKKKALWTVIYPLGVWTAAVYLNHHYIVDLLGGALYAIWGIYTAKKIIHWQHRKEGDSGVENNEDLSSKIYKNLEIKKIDNSGSL